MRVQIIHKQKNYTADLNNPFDLSISMGINSVLAWGVSSLDIKPFQRNNWIADVTLGSPVNFNNIFFNPHAHGTHTECVGHISSNKESINQELKRFFFISKLISVSPKKQNQDFVITKSMIEKLVNEEDGIDALIVRTLPNSNKKLSKNYTGTNPPYLLQEAAKYIVEIGIKHLLIDLPSVDREQDDGLLTSHKAFWNYPINTRRNCTITELIYVDNSISDDFYLLNLQFSPFENDASPSRPLIFKLERSVK